MTNRVDWKTSDDRRDVVHRAVQTLVEGGLAAFPTETVYGIAAYPLAEQSVTRLVEMKQREPAKPIALAFGSLAKLYEYFPKLSPLARRLAERCLPGPITLVLPRPSDAAFETWPESVRRLAAPETGVGVRIPSHEAISETLRLLPYPLLLTSANAGGQEPAENGQEIEKAFGDQLAMIIDDGPTPLGAASTVVRVDGNELSILREGAVPASRLKRLASEVVVFVCTGNSCRSPMAEAIFKRMLAESLNCPVDELPERGYTIMSAGVSAASGSPATSGALQAVQDYGASLADHVSQGLSAELIRLADRIVVMTCDHRDAIQVIAPGLWPVAQGKTSLLGGDQNVDDPIGGSLDQYRACAGQIAEFLKPLHSQLLESPSATIRP